MSLEGGRGGEGRGGEGRGGEGRGGMEGGREGGRGGMHVIHILIGMFTHSVHVTSNVIPQVDVRLCHAEQGYVITFDVTWTS